MKTAPKVGMTGEQEFVVETRHTIDFADDGMPAVLSTPWVISLLERAARNALAPCLDTGESSVGTEVDMRHLAPTPVGQTVMCKARVVHVEGPRVAFQIEAYDGSELIARGFHRRHIIRVESFAKRVRAHRPEPK